MLYHPHIYRIDCTDCERFVYNMETGEKIKRRAGNYERRKTPPPCASCPKTSKRPITIRNAITYQRFLAAEAGCRLTDEEAADPIIQQNFATLKFIFDGWRMEHEGQSVGASVMSAIQTIRGS